MMEGNQQPLSPLDSQMYGSYLSFCHFVVMGTWTCGVVGVTPTEPDRG